MGVVGPRSFPDHCIFLAPVISCHISAILSDFQKETLGVPYCTQNLMSSKPIFRLTLILSRSLYLFWPWEKENRIEILL